MGIINIGGEAVIHASGKVYKIGFKEALYLGKGLMMSPLILSIMIILQSCTSIQLQLIRRILQKKSLLLMLK